MIQYTNHELLQLLRKKTVKSMMRVTKTVYNDLKQMGICYVMPTHRETTSSLRNQHWQRKTAESNSVLPIVQIWYSNENQEINMSSKYMPQNIIPP